MLTSSAPRSLSAVVVAVLDRMPDPPATFTAADVLDALAKARTAGVPGARGTADGPGPSVGDVLDAMLDAELASRAADGRAFVVHPDARPF